VIQQWARDRYGARVIIVVVLHTFGRRLNFNCHLHVLISAGGLQESQMRWIPSLYYPRDTLMQKWRDAVVSYLAAALDCGRLGVGIGYGKTAGGDQGPRRTLVEHPRTRFTNERTLLAIRRAVCSASANRTAPNHEGYESRGRVLEKGH